MPTSKVITLVFLIFIYMIPPDCKITIFPYTCLFSILKITKIISLRAPK